MSFFKPKMPKAPVPVAEADPNSAEAVAARADKAEASQVDWLRERRAGATDVAGSAMAAEDQFGRGLLSMKKRKAAQRALMGQS